MELQRVNRTDAIQPGTVYRFDFDYHWLKAFKQRPSVEADVDRKMTQWGVREWQVRIERGTTIGFILAYHVLFRASEKMAGLTVEELGQDLSNVPGVNPRFVEAFIVSGAVPGPEPEPPGSGQPQPEPAPAFSPFSIFFVAGMLAALFMPSVQVKTRSLFKEQEVTVKRKRLQKPFQIKRVRR